MKENSAEQKKEKKPSVFGILAPYRTKVILISIAVIVANGLGLVIPKLIARGIDTFRAGTLDMNALSIQFVLICIGIVAFYYMQNLVQVYLSEQVGRDLRNRMAGKIAGLSYVRLEQETPAKLLTNLTSDIDAIKMFASFGFSMIISSVTLIVGAAVLLFVSNWKLALVVLALLPLMGVAFGLMFAKLGPLFEKSQGVVDKLNAVISESIVGAALVRVFDASVKERTKFEAANTEALGLGMRILRSFAFLIPTVSLVANLATLAILALGGWFVIGGTMTVGEFTAFYGYLALLIFPIIMLGFVSNMLARAQASYGRISDVLHLPEEKDDLPESAIRGDIEIRSVSLSYVEKEALKNV